MKLIKIFGIVLGLHAFVIGSLFVLPGCSTTSKEDSTTEPPALSDRRRQSCIQVHPDG